MTVTHAFNDLLLQKMVTDPYGVEDEAFDYFSRRLKTGTVKYVGFRREGDELRLHLRLEINGQEIVHDKVWRVWALQTGDHPMTQLFERELNKAVASALPPPEDDDDVARIKIAHGRAVDLKEQASRSRWKIFDATGHFPECKTWGCEMMRCAEARMAHAYSRSLESEEQASREPWDGEA